MSVRNTAELAARLTQRAADVSAMVAYSVVPLDGGEPIRAHADTQLPTASTFKLYLLAALYAADAAGKLSLDERVVYSAADYTRGSGVLKLLAPGAALTLRDYAADDRDQRQRCNQYRHARARRSARCGRCGPRIASHAAQHQDRGLHHMGNARP